MAFISIYSIAWVKLTIQAARSDTATFVRSVFLLARRAKEGQRPRCAADSAPGAGEALGGQRLLLHPFPKPAPFSDAPLPLLYHTCPDTVPKAANSNSHQNWLFVSKTCPQPGSQGAGTASKGTETSLHAATPLCKLQFYSPHQMERERGGKLTWKKIEAVACSCFLPLFFLGCLI